MKNIKEEIMEEFRKNYDKNIACSCWPEDQEYPSINCDRHGKIMVDVNKILREVLETKLDQLEKEVMECLPKEIDINKGTINPLDIKIYIDLNVRRQQIIDNLNKLFGREE